MKSKKKPISLEVIKKWVKLRIKDLEIFEPEKILKDIIQEKPELKDDDLAIGRILEISKNLLKEKPSIIEKQERDSEKERNFYEYGDIIAEEIFDGKEVKFVVYNKSSGENAIASTICVHDETILPMNNEAIEKGAVLIPSGIEDFKDIETLIKDIQEHIKKYVDMGETFLKFSVYYILLSWVSDKLNTVPYLRIIGDTGTGKSRFLDVIGRLCYKAIVIGGAITPAPIYRMVEKWKGTLIIDEADRKQSDTTDEIIKILNCGFERGRPVMRCNKDNPDDIQIHDVFGPKVMSSRYRFYDKALESRCITVVTSETDRTDIPPILPPSFYKEEGIIRNKLLMFRFKTREKITLDVLEHLNEIGMDDIEPRLKQTSAPFFVLFGDDKIKNEFRDFIREYNKEMIEERSGSWEGIIVNVIKEMRENGIEEISSSDIRDAVNKNRAADKQITSQSIGQTIKSLGLKTVRKRVGDENKRFIIFEEKSWNIIVKRYVPCSVCSDSSGEPMAKVNNNLIKDEYFH